MMVSPCQSPGCDECTALVGMLMAVKAMGMQRQGNLCLLSDFWEPKTTLKNKA